MATLLIIDGQGKRSSIELDEAGRYTVGRSESCDIVVRDPMLSRAHAEIYVESGQWMLVDRGSLNGTFVGDRRLKTPVRMAEAGRIRLGQHALELEAEKGSEVGFSDHPMTTGNTVMLSLHDAALDASAATAMRDAGDVRLELEAIRRRFAIVEKANLELLAHESMEVMLPRILDLVFEAVEPERAALLRLDPEGKLDCRAYRGRQDDELKVSRTICNTVIEQQVSVLTADALSDARFAEGQSIVAQGIRSVLAVPLWNNKEVIGIIYADSRLGSRSFDEDDLKLLTMLANVAAIQIENAILFEEQLEKRRFEREAQAAAKMQRQLLPSEFPSIPGYRYLGMSEPCYEVGGDYFDWLAFEENRYGLLLGDVAGKGMQAALLMAGVQATFHARAESGPPPSELVKQLNDAVARTAPSNRFVTFFYMDLDFKKHRVRCVNAGHAPSPLVVRASGEIEELRAKGPPLGIMTGLDFAEVELDLGPGDMIFVCSDGLTEAVDPDGTEFGEDRLAEELRLLAGRPPDEVQREIEERLRAHSRGEPATDDLTLVAVQRSAG